MRAMRVSVALADVRSAHNVGSVFRTADAAGAVGVFLIGTTPAPIDRFGRPQPDIAKVALGAEKSVPWTQYENAAAFIAAMKKENCAIVAVEQDARAVDYKSFTPSRDCVLAFGNEISGVSGKILDAAEAILSIPMHGKKESLNVAVAAGVVLYRLCDV